MSTIKVNEQDFIKNVDEVFNILLESLLEKTKGKEYLAAEIYLAIKKLLLAYGNVMGSEAVKKVEQGTMLVNSKEYKEC